MSVLLCLCNCVCVIVFVLLCLCNCVFVIVFVFVYFRMYWDGECADCRAVLCGVQTCSRCLQSPSSGRYRGSCQQPCWPSYFPQTIVKCICLICQKYLSKLSNAFPMSPPSSRTRGSWWAPCRRSYFPQTPTLTNQPLHTIATITLYTFHHLFLIIALGIRFLSWIDIDLFQRERERATERMRVNVLCGWGGNGTLPWLSGQSYSLFIQARTPTNAITNKSENVGDRRGSSCCSSSLSNLKS